MLGFNEQLERIGEVAVVVLLGAMLLPRTLAGRGRSGSCRCCFLVIRPAGGLGWACSARRRRGCQRRLIGWFGIRGIGSIYYLTYAIEHGLPAELARPLDGLTLATVAVSIVVHGISVTPLMDRYGRRAPGRSAAATPSDAPTD